MGVDTRHENAFPIAETGAWDGFTNNCAVYFRNLPDDVYINGWREMMWKTF